MNYYILCKRGGDPKLINADGSDQLNARLMGRDREFRVESFASKEARDESFTQQVNEIREEAEFERSLR